MRPWAARWSCGAPAQRRGVGLVGPQSRTSEASQHRGRGSARGPARPAAAGSRSQARTHLVNASPKSSTTAVFSPPLPRPSYSGIAARPAPGSTAPTEAERPSLGPSSCEPFLHPAVKLPAAPDRFLPPRSSRPRPPPAPQCGDRPPGRSEARGGFFPQLCSALAARSYGGTARDSSQPVHFFLPRQILTGKNYWLQHCGEFRRNQDRTLEQNESHVRLLAASMRPHAVTDFAPVLRFS